MKYHFYNDPGHGWLKVQRAELVELGLTDRITSCSYQRGAYVYLEEDCDFRTFWLAKWAGKTPPEFVEHHSDRQSRIRNYAPYSKGLPAMDRRLTT